MDGLEVSRSRVSETGSSSRARVSETGSSALPGYEGRSGRSPLTDTMSSTRMTPPSASPLYDTPATPEPANGFAAAYRAVNTPPRGQQPPYAADQTARMSMPFDPQQATGPIPRADNGGSTSGNWPIPSPPPVGEAPPSAYDPLQDTGYNIPTYGGNSGTASYLTGDVRDTGESNTMYGAYNPNDTYNSGPATDQTSGQSYDSPGSGEPWNTPSGGYR
jgi:hypothetical protein